MSARALLALDLLATVLVAGAWIGAALSRHRLALVGAFVLTIARVVLVVALARQGWPLAQEKVVLSLPLLVIPAVVVLFRRTNETMIAAACGAAAGIVVAFVVGYPATFVNSAIVVALVVSVYLLMIGRWRRSSIALLVAALVFGPGLAMFATPAHSTHGTNVDELRLAADAVAGKTFELTAAKTASGAWAFNGSVPGPQLRVRKGDVVEVLLRNTDIEEGVTLHWHGYPVPNGDDGVAGVTQDAVMPGGEFRYRFRADKAGTFWYHTHQVSHRGVKKGLFGTLVVEDGPGLDFTVVQHRLVSEVSRQPVEAGTPVRLRLVNADDTAHRFVVTGGVQWRLAAVDGTDLVEPQLVADRALRLTAGGRYDVTFTMPSHAVGLSVDGKRRLDLSGEAAITEAEDLDLLSYGLPDSALPTAFDREHTLVLDRQLRLLKRFPVYAYTINGRVWPQTPPMTVREGELVKLTVVNRDKEAHPMHPHGHQVRVLSRNGVAVSGSPLWMDSFEVLSGETWEVALRADNPGVWMSHCHNLPHAAKGMMLHLQYVGFSTDFEHGGHNHPE